ncbi:SWIM zinc finger domain-containing protein [Ammoniphilus sp. CFH 90114]|uniref:SWIM zinc finger family protein n=1 Tax=Ammoniphilus sp. CFH 90114 TaxID=2493665 RepID=UPI00100DFD6A|nr:SWIM zinc finger family protein [Ammoniphilus sp. CFH 90114]RXT15421.1 hypothetical protein EIZ39_04275 [Ammoniphilus sp. CFH 90114]
MRYPEINKNKVLHTAETVREAVDEVILQRGLDYYQRGFVQSTVARDNRIDAIVKGTRQYHVILNLDQFFESHCSCPYHVVCKHIVATVCQVLSLLTDPEQFFLSSQEESTVELLETDSPGRWMEIFEQAFPLYVSGLNYDLTYRYEKFFADMEQHTEFWSKPQRFLYELYLLLFGLQKLEDVSRRSTYGLDRQLKDAFHLHLNRLQYLTLTDDKASPNQIKEWASLLTFQVLASDTAAIDWLVVYRQVWSHMMVDTESTWEEKLKLEGLWSHPSLPLVQKRTLRLMLAHMEFMLGQDESARALLEPVLEANELFQFHSYLSLMSHMEQWDRLYAWLHWLRPQLKYAERFEVHMVLRYWAKWAEVQSTDEEWMDVLVSFLPSSTSFYVEHLLRTEQYRLWVDFHLAEGFIPPYIHKDILKRIEAAHLPALLPLYHRAVEQFIREKNRKSYKQAVKMLKKLRTFYKKLKQVERWNIFILQLVDKHKRLRALQEELQKGKLIP